MKCKHTSTVTLFTHTALKKPNPHQQHTSANSPHKQLPAPQGEETQRWEEQGESPTVCVQCSSHSCLSSSSCSGPVLRSPPKSEA